MKTLFPGTVETNRLSELNQELSDLPELVGVGVYSTSQIYSKVQEVVPHLCNDKYTMKQRYGDKSWATNTPVWKQVVRTALKDSARSNNQSVSRVGKRAWDLF